MSGHGANPILFNKRDKDWTSRTLVNPPSATHSPSPSDTISILPYPEVFLGKGVLKICSKFTGEHLS